MLDTLSTLSRRFISIAHYFRFDAATYFLGAGPT